MAPFRGPDVLATDPAPGGLLEGLLGVGVYVCVVIVFFETLISIYFEESKA